MVILENNKNENFKCQNYNGKCFIFDPLLRDQKPVFKILPGFRHRSDQIYHILKSPLGDPLIILPSIHATHLTLLNIIYDSVLDPKWSFKITMYIKPV